jgi:hypothetical protein
MGVNDAVDAAIVGAGPYGLSLAAHLRSAGVRFRQFGLPMDPWRSAMPRGMYLKSQGFASTIARPRGTHTLEAFCKATGRPAPRTWTNCLSSSTCCAARCPWSVPDPSGPTSPPGSASRSRDTRTGSACPRG